MTLVDKGVFGKMLNGRIPTKNALETTGSSRFMMIPQSPTVATGTGTIHVQVDKLASSNADVMLDSSFESEEKEALSEK